MKHVITGIRVLFLIMVVGCAATPRASFAKSQDIYIAAVGALITAFDSGRISQDDWDQHVLPAINAGNAALDAYDKATQAGLSKAPALEQLLVALEAMRPWVLSLQKEDK